MLNTEALVDLSVVLLVKNKLLNHKLKQGMNTRQILFYESSSLPEATSLYNQFDPKVLILDGSFLLQQADFLTSLHASMPAIKVIVVGNRGRLEPLIKTDSVIGILETPFLPENLPAKIIAVLYPDRSEDLIAETIFGERRLMRFPVSKVRLRVYHPVYMMTDVLDLSYIGLRAKAGEDIELTVKEDLKLEIMTKKGNLNLEGAISWVQGTQFGVTFSNKKPAGFRSMIKALSQPA
ncbi:MAG: hypothetical protein QNK37_27440 [Acidobacteriota bacterium]|nr:hypothetical protein [Acidobacteriota bacterium]